MGCWSFQMRRQKEEKKVAKKVLIISASPRTGGNSDLL